MPAPEKNKKRDTIVNKTVVAFSHDAIVTITLDGIITHWNPAAEKIYGYTSQEVIGKPITMLCAPYHIRECTKVLRFIKKGNYIHEFETVGVRKNMQSIDLAVSIIPTKDNTGEVIGGVVIARDISKLIAIAKDITERKKLEKNLRFLAEGSAILASSLDYHQTLWSIAKLAVPTISEFCAIDMIDDQGEIKLVAGWHQDIQKLKINLDFRKKYPPDINAKEGAGRVLRTGKSALYTSLPKKINQRYDKDPAYRAYLKKLQLTTQMSVPLKIQNDVIGVLSFASSAKRQLTKNDLLFAEELAKRAALAIENARLYSLAQESIAVRDDFMAVASHELKTPITSMKFFIQIMQKKLKKDSEVQKSFGKITKQLDKLIILVKELLDINKIQQGKVEIVNEHFKLTSLIREITEEIELLEDHHTLVLHLQKKGFITTDKEHLRQVLTNILDNAVKYSSEGTEIIVRSREKKKMLLLSVQDFVGGIMESEQEKIFERFYKSKVTRTYPGLGLGLYFAKDIIGRMGGDIWVESKRGKGSTFYIRLPV